MIRGNYPVSVDLAKESIRCFEECNNELGIADAKYAIAGTLYKTDDYRGGLGYLIDCLLIYQKFGDHHNESKTRKSIGTIYEYYGDQEAAIATYEAAIRAAQKVKDLNLQSNALNPLSGILLNQGKVHEAMEMIERSICMKEEAKDVRGLAFSLYGRGKIHAALKDFESAEADYLRSIAIHTEMGEKLGVGMAYHKLGALYLDQKQYEKAQETLIKALDFANRNNIALIKFKGNYLLYHLHKELGDHAKSLEYLEHYVREKELVINTQTLKLIDSYDAISKMEAAEAEIKAEKERSAIIEQKNLELDAFFYRVSHDLKGPITSILGLDFVAREELTEDRAVEFLDMYKDQVLRINHIIDSLIKFTRSNHFAEVAEEIDFSKMIRECIASFNYLPNFDLIHFQIDVGKDTRLKAEWSLVNAILQNLIENAIKYIRPDQPQPSVHIRIQQDQKQVKVIVEDNGVGMDMETRQNTFDMFYQGDEVAAGTGLGLYIVKKSVKQLNGNLELESELGQGTTFKISIPQRES